MFKANYEFLHCSDHYWRRLDQHLIIEWEPNLVQPIQRHMEEVAEATLAAALISVLLPTAVANWQSSDKYFAQQIL